ncbi:MAG: DUF6285 domain-containing protein [Kiloniellaceae bacterium]
MTAANSRGGEADAARLLELARRELLEGLVPALEGDARYRARLIANALKIAAAGLREEAEGSAAAARDLAAFAARSAPEEGLTAAIRAGRLDGEPELYALLLLLTEGRRAGLG